MSGGLKELVQSASKEGRFTPAGWPTQTIEVIGEEAAGVNRPSLLVLFSRVLVSTRSISKRSSSLNYAQIE